MEDKAGYIEKIKKLFALASNNPSEEEAASAALQAQRLMAKYSISPEEVEGGADAAGRRICEFETEPMKDSRTWRFRLGEIVAKAFRCEFLQRSRAENGRLVPSFAFYGYEGDAMAAKLTFDYLYKQGTRLARRCERERKKEAGFVRGVFNSFVFGFADGVESELEIQSRELMIVESEEVKRAWAEHTEGMGEVSPRSASVGDDAARSDGFSAGRAAVTSRRMSGSLALC